MPGPQLSRKRSSTVHARGVEDAVPYNYVSKLKL